METDPFLERLAQIRLRFAAKLPVRLSSVQTALPDLDHHPELLEISHRNVHELCGIAPTIGFPETGQRARQLEQILLQPLRARRAPSADEMSAVREALQRLQTAAQLELESFAAKGN